MALKNYKTHEILAEFLRRQGYNPAEYTKAVGHIIDMWEQRNLYNPVSIEFFSAMNDLIEVVEG